MDDQNLAVLQLRLDELGVDDLTVGGFIGAYNAADYDRRRQLKAMGDRALLRFVRALPAARHARADLEVEELRAQSREVVVDRNVKGVIDWVDGDATRAEMARTAERESARPRRSLLEVLDALVERD